VNEYEGTKVGLHVGKGVGFLVGANVGLNVGFAEGGGVGFFVGRSDGISDGIDGSWVGESVVSAVGVIEGASALTFQWKNIMDIMITKQKIELSDNDFIGQKIRYLLLLLLDFIFRLFCCVGYSSLLG
jgi:hypothetical protein